MLSITPFHKSCEVRGMRCNSDMECNTEADRTQIVHTKILNKHLQACHLNLDYRKALDTIFWYNLVKRPDDMKSRESSLNVLVKNLIGDLKL